MKTKTEEMYASMNPWRLFFVVALPGMISMFAMSVYSVVEGIFLGQTLGEGAFAAVNIAMPLVMINFSLSDLIGVGASVPISIALGQDDKETANNTFTGKNIFEASNNYNTTDTQKFIVGNSSSAFVFGGDGLQCFSGTNSTTPKAMYINYYGGDVLIGKANGTQSIKLQGISTLSGNASIIGHSGDTPLIVQSKATNAYIQFKDTSGTNLGYMGYISADSPAVFLSTGAKKIWHEGNFTPGDYLPLAGGNMTGHIYMTGASPSSSTANTSQLIFGTPSSEHLAITSNTGALVLNPNKSSTTN